MMKIKLFIKDRKTRIKMLTLLIFILYMCFFILTKPKETAQGAKNGLLFSGNTLIPSLFPFMFISSFAIKSGLAVNIEKYFSKVTEKLLGLPGYCSTTVILSMIGGYPVGARGVKALYDAGLIDDAQAQKMMCFCVGAGPAFVVSVVGQQMLNSTAIGVILLISQILSSILLGIGVNLSEKRRFLNNPLIKKQEKKKKTQVFEQKNDIITAIVDSCTDCCSGMLNMCTFVIIFSAFIAILDVSGATKAVSAVLNVIGFEKSVSNSIISLLLEVMGGCKAACENAVNPVIIAFAICWGGICVHFQLFTALSKINISKKRFWMFRFIHGAVSAAITYICIVLYNPIVPTFSGAKRAFELTQGDSVIGSAVLIITCMIFLVSVREKEA